MESKATNLDVFAYMANMDKKDTNSPITKAENILKPLKTTMVQSSDGVKQTISKWFSQMNDQDRIKVHCPIAPHLHTNGDANPSCYISKNGDYLNIHCFGCSNKESIYFGDSKSKSGADFELVIPDFDKRKALRELKTGLTSLTQIIEEAVRLLPALEGDNDE